MFADGKSLGKDSDWTKPTTYLVPANTRVLSVAGKDTGSQFGIIGSTSHGLVTDETWKCSSDPHSEWNSPDFDDQDWPLATVVANHGTTPGGKYMALQRGLSGYGPIIKKTMFIVG